MRLFLLIILVLLSRGLQAQKSAPLTRIAFGSFGNQELTEQMRKEIVGHKPQLCTLPGDTIYGDTHDMTLIRSDKITFS